MSTFDLSSLQLVLGAGLTISIALVMRLVARQYGFLERGRLPPGPPWSAWRGTTLPRQHPWRTMKQWTDTYGPLITVRLGNAGGLLFVCGDATVADALLQKQSNVTGSRPRLIMAGDLLSDNKRTLILQQGPRLRAYRKVMHEALNNTQASQYESIQAKEAALTAYFIGRKPDTFQQQFVRYAASVIMTLTYDLPVRSLDDPLVRRVNECSATLGKWINPSASPLDSWPLLNYIPTPLNPWRKLGKALHKRELTLFLETYRGVRERAKQGKAQSCFATQLQEKQQELNLTDEEACYVAGSLFGAGSDTTASALAIFVMAMIAHPHVAAKAQAELDRVVGASRLPSFSDFDDMPYMQALCQEVSRWRPVSSGGFRHMLTADVRYKEYMLPKGSMIVGNHWSIHLDPNEYANPDVFDPQRFLSHDDTEVHGTWFSTRGHYQFGFGRRVCVGSSVAERSIWINAATMLWAFNFRAPGGREQDVDMLAFTSHANSHPLPFAAEISFRSDDRRRTLEQEAQAFL